MKALAATDGLMSEKPVAPSRSRELFGGQGGPGRSGADIAVHGFNSLPFSGTLLIAAAPEK